MQSNQPKNLKKQSDSNANMQANTNNKIDQNLISHLINKKIPVVVFSKSLDFSFSTLIIKINVNNNELTLKNTIPLEFIHHLINKKDFLLNLPEYSFFSKFLSGNGVDFIFKIEKMVSHSSINAKRSFKRASLPASKKGVISIINPFDKVTKLEKVLLTISEGGLSFQSNYPSLLFARGQNIKGVRIYFDNKFFKEVDIKISYQKKYFDIKSLAKFQIGAAFSEPIAEIGKIVQVLALNQEKSLK